MVGRANGSTAKGAIIGAAVGGTAGAVIGHQMDQQAKEIKQNIPGAVVERVGEGLQVTFESGLLFDYDSDVLRADGAARISRRSRQSLDKYPNTDLLIVGHTDATGTDAYNMTLSERRAAAAASYLVSAGRDARAASLGGPRRERAGGVATTPRRTPAEPPRRGGDLRERHVRRRRRQTGD